MKQIRQKSEYERKGSDVTTYPSQYDNADYGKKRKAKTHNVVMKNSKTGQVFGYKTVEEGDNSVYPNAIVIYSKRGTPVGEIYQDHTGWGCLHYRTDVGADGMDNREDALEELKDIHGNYMQNRGNWKTPEYRPMTESFKDYLLLEAEDTRLPNSVIGEITGLIRKGAKDLQQAWKNVFELVHTAYHVANVKRPTPDQKGAWKQYEDLLRIGVKALADTRGLSGTWRSSSTAFTEDAKTDYLDQILEEKHQGRNHRIFVRVRNIGFDDAEEEHEVEAGSIDEVIQSLQAQAKRNGRSVRIVPVAANQIKLIVYVKGITGAEKEEKIIQIKDWSV